MRFSLGGATDVETDLWQRMDALWPLPAGDTSAPPLPDPLPKAIDGGNAQGNVGNDGEIVGQREVKAFAEAAGTPVLARLTINAWPSAARGERSAAGFLRSLRTGGECGVAWRDGMLLICRHNWVRPRYTDPLVPWAVVKRLRADIAADPQRLLPVDSLFFVAARLTPIQMWRLQEGERMGGMEAAAVLQNLLAPLDRDAKRRERLQGKGLPVAALPLPARSPRGNGPEESAMQYTILLLRDERAEQSARLAAALSESPNGVVRLRVTDAPPGQSPKRRAELLLFPAPGAPERVLAGYEWEPTTAREANHEP